MSRSGVPSAWNQVLRTWLTVQTPLTVNPAAQSKYGTSTELVHVSTVGPAAATGPARASARAAAAPPTRARRAIMPRSSWLRPAVGPRDESHGAATTDRSE